MQPRGQLIPDDDHGDAASQTNEDYAVHEMRIISQEDYRQCKHQDGTDDPVLYQGKAEDLSVFENPSQLFILHLGQGRVHHEN